jgi:hypothetical protein
METQEKPETKQTNGKLRHYRIKRFLSPLLPPHKTGKPNFSQGLSLVKAFLGVSEVSRDLIRN